MRNGGGVIPIAETAEAAFAVTGEFGAPKAELILRHGLRTSLVLSRPPARLQQNRRAELWPAACFLIDDVFFLSPLHHSPDADV
jgi:hypothetical protein